MFLFNGELFKQIDGVVMVSLFGFTLPSFLANLGNKFLNKNDSFYPKIYLQYVDDNCAILDHNLSIAKFLNMAK